MKVSRKIIFPGGRADGIVKGMLQHSRSSSGLKELTDINALMNAYARLAYHGLRAKDKSFDATVKKEFDKDTGSIRIIPQEIGRVILNIYQWDQNQLETGTVFCVLLPAIQI